MANNDAHMMLMLRSYLEFLPIYVIFTLYTYKPGAIAPGKLINIVINPTSSVR